MLFEIYTELLTKSCSTRYRGDYESYTYHKKFES